MIHIISLGAGVQSSTMALMAAAGEITPMPVAAIFADTQAEPPSVYKWLDWLEKQLPFPVIRTTQGSLEKDHSTLRKKKADGTSYFRHTIPFFTLDPNGRKGTLLRGCTRDYKIHPVHREVMKLIKARKDQGIREATMWIGISTDEAHRMKPAREPRQTNRWPLIENNISRADCLAWMEKRKLPKPPRSACVFCPFHSNAEWKRLLTEEPEQFARAEKFERTIQRLATRATHANKLEGVPFLHSSRVSLRQAVIAAVGERDQWGNECEGMCGV